MRYHNSVQAMPVQINSAKAWVVCFAAALFFFYDFIQMMMCNALSELLMRDFNTDATGLSKLASVFFLSDVLFLLPAGILIDRFSTRKITLLMLALSIVGAFGFASTSNFMLACVFRFIAGIAHAFCFLCCMAFVARWFTPDKRAFVVGLVITIAMLGGLVAQTPLALLSDAVGWRNAIYINVVMGLCILGFIFAVVQDYPLELGQPVNNNRFTLGDFLQSLKQAAMNKQNWLCGIYTGLLNLPIMLFGAIWGIIYLVQVFGISKTDASVVIMMIYLGTIVGSPVFGKFSDTWSRRKLPMIAGALSALAIIVAIMLGPKWSLTSLLLLFFMLGFLTSSQVISYPTITESNSPQISSTAMGLAAVIIMGIGGIMQPISGWLLDLLWDGRLLNGMPLYTPDNFMLALSIIPIGIGCALLVGLFIRETKCKQL